MSVWLLGGSQVLSNPDFEVGSTSPWQVAGSSVALGVSSVDQYTGSYSALVTCTSGYYGATSGPRFHQGEFLLEAGHAYFARCAIKVASGTLAEEGSISWNITNWAVASTYASDDICVSTLWKTFGFGWTQPSTVNSLRLNIFLPAFTSPESANGGIFIDDVKIYPAVELGAGYDYKFGKVQQRNDTRDRDGGLHHYILPGGHRRFDFPGLNIDSAGRCAVNSFWANADTCYLIEDDTNPTSMYAVKVMDTKEPFQSFALPYGLVRYRYIGDLALETVDAE